MKITRKIIFLLCFSKILISMDQKHPKDNDRSRSNSLSQNSFDDISVDGISEKDEAKIIDCQTKIKEEITNLEELISNIQKLKIETSKIRSELEEKISLLKDKYLHLKKLKTSYGIVFEILSALYDALDSQFFRHSTLNKISQLELEYKNNEKQRKIEELYKLDEIDLQDFEKKSSIQDIDEFKSIVINKNRSFLYSLIIPGTFSVCLDGCIKNKELKEKGSILSLEISKNGKYLLASSSDKYYQVWNINQEPYKIFKCTDNYVINYSSFYPANPFYIIDVGANSFYIWDISAIVSKVILSQRFTSDPICCAFSSDSQYLAIGFENNDLQLWNVSDLKKAYCETFVKGHSGQINCVAFAPNNFIILTGSNDCTAKLWSILGNNITLLNELKGHSSAILSVAISHDGSYALTSSADSTVCLWNIKNLHSPSRLSVIKNHKNAVNFVKFSPDAKCFLSCSRDCTAQIYNITDPEMPELIKIFEENSSIISGDWSSDGRYIITGTWNGNIKLWNISDSWVINDLSLTNLILLIKSLKDNCFPNNKVNLQNPKLQKYIMKYFFVNENIKVKEISNIILDYLRHDIEIDRNEKKEISSSRCVIS